MVKNEASVGVADREKAMLGAGVNRRCSRRLRSDAFDDPKNSRQFEEIPGCRRMCEAAQRGLGRS